MRYSALLLLFVVVKLNHMSWECHVQVHKYTATNSLACWFRILYKFTSVSIYCIITDQAVLVCGCGKSRNVTS